MLKSIAISIMIVLGGCGQAYADALEQSIANWLGHHFSDHPDARWEVAILQGDSKECFTKNMAAGEWEFSVKSLKPKKIMDIQIRKISDNQIVSLKIQARRLVKTVVASELIKAGSEVGAAWHWEERDLDLLPSDSLRSPDELTGKRTRKIFTMNEVICSHALEPEPAVKSGSNVTLRVIGDGVVISTDAVALEDGQPGDWIKCKCAGAQILKAEVKDSQSAQIVLSKR